MLNYRRVNIWINFITSIFWIFFNVIQIYTLLAWHHHIPNMFWRSPKKCWLSHHVLKIIKTIPPISAMIFHQIMISSVKSQKLFIEEQNTCPFKRLSLLLKYPTALVPFETSQTWNPLRMTQTVYGDIVNGIMCVYCNSKPSPNYHKWVV